MKSYDELATIAARTTCDLLEAAAPERDLLMQDAIEPLEVTETLQVVGMVVAQLCDVFDELGQVTGLRELVLRGIASIRAGLDDDPGEGRGEEA